jgi:hypothetical protein
MRFDALLGRFEWLDEQRAYAVLKIDPLDGEELARYEAEQLYSGLCWVGESLWLAHSESRQLIKARLE